MGAERLARHRIVGRDIRAGRAGLARASREITWAWAGWRSLCPFWSSDCAGSPTNLRTQAYVVAGLGALRVFFINFLPITNDDPFSKRWIVAGAAAIAYWMAVRIHFARKRIGQREMNLATFSISVLPWARFSCWLDCGRFLPAVVIGPAWALVALLLMEAGFALDLPSLRLQAHLAGGAAFGRLFFANFTGLGRVGIVSHRVLDRSSSAGLVLLPMVAATAWSARVCASGSCRSAACIYTRAAILAVVLMRFELGRVLTVTGWAAFALGLLVFGRRWNNVDLRWQSYILAALAFWRSWTTNFYAPESFAGVSGRILTGAFVIACFYAAQLLIPQKSEEAGSGASRARVLFAAGGHFAGRAAVL